MIMSDFTGPGRNSEMSTMRSSQRVGLELLEQLALAGRLDLEAPERVGGADQLERGRFVERDPAEVDLLAGRAGDLVEAWRIAESIRTPSMSSFR